MSAVLAKKPKVDLSTVTAPPPPPEHVVFDTTTPPDRTVERFTAVDFPKWMPWLLVRLQQHYPQFTQMNFHGLMNQHIGGNESLLIKSRRGILLATLRRKPFDLRPDVVIDFLFKFNPGDSEQNKEIRPLVNRVKEWACSKGAKTVRVEEMDRCDLNLSLLKDMVGDAVTIVVRDLDK